MDFQSALGDLVLHGMREYLISIEKQHPSSGWPVVVKLQVALLWEGPTRIEIDHLFKMVAGQVDSGIGVLTESINITQRAKSVVIASRQMANSALRCGLDGGGEIK